MGGIIMLSIGKRLKYFYGTHRTDIEIAVFAIKTVFVIMSSIFVFLCVVALILRISGG